MDGNLASVKLGVLASVPQCYRSCVLVLHHSPSVKGAQGQTAEVTSDNDAQPIAGRRQCMGPLCDPFPYEGTPSERPRENVGNGTLIRSALTHVLVINWPC